MILERIHPNRNMAKEMCGAGIVLRPIRPRFEMLWPYTCTEGPTDNSLGVSNPFYIASLRHSQQLNVGLFNLQLELDSDSRTQARDGSQFVWK